MYPMKNWFTGKNIWYVVVPVLAFMLIGEITYLVIRKEPVKKTTNSAQTTVSKQTTNSANSSVSNNTNTKKQNFGIEVAGSYSCSAFLVNGQPSPNGCAWQAPVVLDEEGTYTYSLEQGTYSVSGTTLNLSNSDFRGPAKILKDGLQLQFNYTYDGNEYTVTYNRDGVNFEEEGVPGNTNTEEEVIIIPFANENPEESNMNTKAQEETSVNASAGEPCDPLVPLYAQPDCVEIEE